jgi:hypothetical protein
MKDTSVITSVVSKVRIPTIVLEDIVNHRTRTTRYNYPVSKIERELYCQDLDTFQTYTIQSTVKGNLEIHYLDEWERMETLRMPVAPSFLVTCTKRVEEKYRMEFISSLN